MLARFWTGWAVAGNANGNRAVAIPAEKLRKRPWLELLALALKKAGMQGEKVWRLRTRLFQRIIPEREFREADVVIGFDTAAEILAERCKSWQKPLILDQTTASRWAKKRIFYELGIPLPAADEATVRLIESGERCEQRASARIVVASSFCRSTFAERSELLKKTKVLPYGFDEKFLKAGRERRDARPGAARQFLYVGNLGWHKGIKILLEAWSSIRSNRASLRVVGRGSDVVEDELRRAGI